jgi:hypothetical protein
MQEERSLRWVSLDAGRRRVSVSPAVRAAVVVGVPALLIIVVLARPLLFTSATFNPDWLEQLWFMWKQGLAIQANHAPSLFLNYRYGVFYPQYAFYGGTLYTLTGTLALVLGDAPIAAYVLTYVLGFAAAYGGWYWMARMAGLGRWWAHAPGLVFITSSYYLTLIYARGDWPEFVAISMIPLMVAAGLSVLRADRIHPLPACVLVAATTVFFGSHSLTVVWGSTTIALSALALVVFVPQARRQLTRAGALRVVGLATLGALLNAWFLLPAAVYESQTRIASEYPVWEAALRDTMRLVSAPHLFTLSRASASAPGTAFALSLPIVVIGWVLASIAIAVRKGLGNPWARVLLICSSLTLLTVVLMTHAGLILALPHVYSTLQFSYRLESYVLLGLSGALLAALAMIGRATGRTRVWQLVLIPVLAISVAGAIQQADAYPKAKNSDEELSRYQILNSFQHLDAAGLGRLLPDYIDVHQPVLTSRHGHPQEVSFPTGGVRDDRVSTVVHLQPGQLVYSNLFGPPDLVNVEGATIVGINNEGYDVLEIAPGARTPRPGARLTERVSVSTGDSLPIVLGRVLTLLALVVSILGAVALMTRSALARARS